MKRKLKNFLRTAKKRRRLKASVGTDMLSFQETIEQALIKKLGIRGAVRSDYHDLGGLNNLGMFVHRFEAKGEPFAITKVQSSASADREYRFQKWQERYVDNQLAASAFAMAPLQDENYSWISSEILSQATTLSDGGVWHLFSRLDVSSEKLAELSPDRCAKSLICQLEGDTKIKAVLRNLVSQLETASAKMFAMQFLKEREYMLSMGLYGQTSNLFLRFFERVKEQDISSLNGLVHGDFKPQNIMVDSADNFKVVDLQYYTYGVRIWDLAFYYSKDDRGFAEIYPKLMQNFSWTDTERGVFAFFYYVASALHLKAKKVPKIGPLKLEPAMIALSASLK